MPAQNDDRQSQQPISVPYPDNMASIWGGGAWNNGRYLSTDATRLLSTAESSAIHFTCPAPPDPTCTDSEFYCVGVDNTPAGSNAGARNANTQARPANTATRHANSGTRNMGSEDWRNQNTWGVGPSRSTSSPRDEGSINSINHNTTPLYDNTSIQDNSMPYRRRSPQENTFMINNFGIQHNHTAPSPRQTQPPANPFSHGQTHGHTPSNSIQSQRPMPTHSSSFHQSTNSRAFNSNRQRTSEDLSSEYGRHHLTMDDNGVPAMSSGPTALGRTNFNPASQPFEATSRSQSSNGMSSMAALASQFDAFHVSVNNMNRAGVDRISAAQNSRPEQVRDYGNFTSGAEMFNTLHDPQNGTFRPNIPMGIDQETLTALRYGVLYNGDPFALNPYPLPTNFRPQVHPGYLPQLAASYPVPMPSDQDRRSSLLNDYRGRARNRQQFTLSHIYNHIVEFSGDQQGSRFVQQQIDTANSEEKERIFKEIEPNAVQLMKDLFGNYVIQKFFDHGSQLQKKILADKMRGKMVDMSTQMYSCRVVQKAMDHILVEQQAALVQELKPKIVEVIKDEHGNHVIQKIIQLVPREHIGFIMDAFKGNVREFATHSYGCRVIQRILEHGLTEDKAMFLEELHASWKLLFNDQYGNYVAQHIIEKGEPKDRNRVVELVMFQLLTLSKQKQASNVVEQCVEFCTPQQRAEMRRMITTVGENGSMPLESMITDQFGNYVIQKLLTFLEPAEKQLLVEKIKPLLDELKKNGTSKQIQGICKLLDHDNESTTTTSAATPAMTPASTPGGTPALNGLHVDVNSSTPTPVLTNESNSPQSSGPPSTNASAFGGSASGDADRVHSERTKRSDVMNAGQRSIDGLDDGVMVEMPGM